MAPLVTTAGIKIYVPFDGSYTDTWVWGGELDSELLDWGESKFRFRGRTYDLTWLDGDESDQVRTRLGVDHEDQKPPYQRQEG